MSLRKAPTTGMPGYDEWHVWPAGMVFDAPDHMNVDRALARGIAEEVSDAEE